ncbi:GlcNAc-transferase family protein [Rhodococcus sp. ABRD24]|uniref:GlcNAc-transferase family protein n=1 Tax=Rhodococcus sp. ABRD24 TaxID=2507582 RepID=UPI0013F17039|nr:GlcNAc-transferase family protein [Rhodococcus sp. ABRD24]
MLTVDRTSGSDKPDLYVQVPAYRDLELVPTLRDLYAQAAQPSRLRVRVMWQRAEDEVLPDDVLSLPRLEVDRVPAATSEGCNWARQRLQKAWEGERYTLLLDSHHRFVAGWDDLALRMLEQLRAAGTLKPMLTGYLPAYSPRSDLFRSTRPQRLYPFARDEGVLTRLKGAVIRDSEMLTEPVPADFASLHFLLADGCFNDEVQFDPTVYFFGDEVLTTVRAFAAMYRLFHPYRVIGWHAYDRNSRVTHWADHTGHAERHARSLTALRHWFRGERDISSAEVSAFEAHVNLCLVV